MSKRPFMAVNWLTAKSTDNTSVNSKDYANTTVYAQSANQAVNQYPSVKAGFTPNHFDLGQYVIPQWKGESLITKDGLKLKKLSKQLFTEAFNLSKTFNSRNKTLKLTVYNEFINFAEYENINISQINDFNQFWACFNDENSAQYKNILKFLSHYSLRAVNIYLLKLRFITLISRQIAKSLSANELLNPDFTIGKIFKKSSSTELICDSLKLNEFSWFRPSLEQSSNIIELSSILTTLGSVEFLKICNHEIPTELSISIKDSQSFSHSISNRNFGLFVNDLLIYFTQWLEGHNGQMDKSGAAPKCLNTLFTGDHLYSYALSHWLAQENNVEQKWNEVICPEFDGNGFQTGSYIKVCQELQFLTFLVNMAKNQQHDPITLICQLFKQKNSKSLVNSDGQLGFFNNTTSKDSVYDRVVLNLDKMPRTNSHHYLLSSIQSYSEKLSNSGYLFVFSNQKLFVPSHSDKVENLLKKYKIHAAVNFEDLKGKGEISKYLYIFSKRIYSEDFELFGSTAPKLQKESCLSLNFQGQLMHFSKFDLLRKEFHKFITTKDSINSPIYQNEPEVGLLFDFHQDAILNGKLLSNSSDSNKITHPSYFKNLTRTCVPLDQFFMIEHMSIKDSSFKTDLLGLRLNANNSFQYMLIVNFTNENSVTVELTSADLYKVKAEEYGHAYFQYFGLTPKISNLNINLFREFFETSVGKQVIQLTFNVGLKKTKSKLKAMLVPKFLAKTEILPSQHHTNFDFFSISSEEIKSSHPLSLKEDFEHTLSKISTLSKSYPWHVSCILSQFKYHLESALGDVGVDSSESRKINYSNSMMINELVKLKTHKIYPSHDDIFIESKLSDKNDIHKRVTNSNLSKSESGHVLKLYSDERELIYLHGEYEILHFANFILSNTKGNSLSSILQNLELPRANEVKQILSQFSDVEKGISEILSSTQKSINDIIIGQILN